MDPLSIAASTAGLLSLGITISKGAIDFWQDCQSRDTDIRNLVQKATKLEDLATLAKAQLEQCDGINTAVRTSLTELFQAGKECSESARALLIKLQSNSRGKQGNSKIKNIIYPFKDKQRLAELVGQVNEFQAALNVQLTLLNLDQTSTFHRANVQTANALASQITVQGRAMLDHLADIEPALTKTVNMSIRREACSLGHEIGLLRSEVASALAKITTTSESDAAICVREPAKHQITLAEASHVLTKPSTLTLPRLEGTPESNQHKLSQASTVAQTNSLWKPKCNCRNQVKNIFETQARDGRLQHDTTCPLSISQGISRQISSKLMLFNFLFRCDISVKYSRHSFLRSLQVLPNFTVKSVVAYDAPALRLLKTLVSDFRQAQPSSREDVVRLFDKFLRDLHRLYQDGAGWPTDIDNSGNNLMTTAMRMFFVTRKPTSFWSLSYGLRADIFMEFIKSLASLGMDINDPQNHPPAGRHQGGLRGRPLGRPLPTPNAYDQLLMVAPTKRGLTTARLLVSQLSSLGATASADHQFWLVFDRLSQGASASSRRELALTLTVPYYGELSRAIIDRNEPLVLQLLKESPEKLFEKGQHGDTPFHIATLWPQGLQHLLECEANQGWFISSTRNSFPGSGFTPLAMAIMQQQTPAVRTLLEAGANVGVDDIIAPMTSRYGTLSFHTSSLIRRLVAQELSRRRRRLAQLAKEHLNANVISTFLPTDQSLMQGDIRPLTDILERQGVQIPRGIQGSFSFSVYHLATKLPLALADEFWHAGFDSVDVVHEVQDGTHMTPLVSHVCNTVPEGYIYPLGKPFDLPWVTWLLEHGADSHAAMPQARRPAHLQRMLEIEPSHKIIHFLAVGFSTTDEWNVEKVRDLLSEYDAPGPCTCYCTDAFCTASLIYTRSRLQWLTYWCRHGYPSLLDNWELDAPAFEYGLLVTSSIYAIEMDTKRGFSSQFVFIIQSIARSQDIMQHLAVVRLATFQRLGMQHTCCVLDFAYEGYCIRKTFDKCLRTREPQEVAEIQEEDKYLISDLEMLMEDFEAELRKGEGDIVDFLLGYWWDTMSEYERQKSVVSAEEWEAMRSVGVVLEEVS